MLCICTSPFPPQFREGLIVRPTPSAPEREQAFYNLPDSARVHALGRVKSKRRLFSARSFRASIEDLAQFCQKECVSESGGPGKGRGLHWVSSCDKGRGSGATDDASGRGVCRSRARISLGGHEGEGACKKGRIRIRALSYQRRRRWRWRCSGGGRSLSDTRARNHRRRSRGERWGTAATEKHSVSNERRVTRLLPPLL